MLFVYSTPAFDKKMQSSNFKVLQTCIKALRNRIEKKQQYTGFTPFNDGFYVKKKLQYKYRLIASTETIPDDVIDGEEHELLVFHDLMIRKDPDYNNPGDAHCFCRDPEGFAKSHNYRTYDHKERCIEYCKKRLNEQNVPKPKKEPSNYENEILYGTLRGAKDRNSISIYEMKAWVTSLNDKENYEILHTSFLSKLYGSVIDVMSAAAANDLMGWNIQKFEYGSGRKRWFSYYYNPDESIFALGRIATVEDEAKSFNSKYKSVFDPFDKNTVLKHISRSYPETVVQNPDDPTLWENIETEKSNNMALSPEELDILSSVLNSESRKYPLFINGRAGSGKSTILQFLFTSYYFHYLHSKDEHDASPIYFTYNERLLSAARETVDKLLENHEYLGSINDETEKRAIEDKKKASREISFRNFSDFLLDVASINKPNPFLPHNKIDFQMFKTLWHKRFKNDQEIMRKTTPEICWHVIRTYIKGDSVEALVDVAEYETSPGYSISKEMFKLVYEKVWLPWYSDITLFTDKGEQEFEVKAKTQYWDDQDLVRYVLNEDEESESGSLLNRYFEEHDRFSAIFCDESQDFTRIELEAILEMSLFLYRKVNWNYVNKIPFIFAGDPFQTLNPTGFSWEATKKGFVEKIARVLDKKASTVDLNYKELKMNYRSDSNIVKFSNAVQVIRAAKLNPEKNSIEPQLPWNDEPGSCLFYDWKNAEFWKWLEKNGDVSFILPCESSNRSKFIDDNPILRERLYRMDHVPGKDLKTKYPVFSAQDIKGLEYDKVVVFGFGAFDRASQEGGGSRFAKLLDDGIKDTDSHLLEMEYFINRLYVAITRPRRQLLILDEPSNTFWDKFKVDVGAERPVIDWLERTIPKNCKEAWNKDGKASEKFALPIRGYSSSLSGETSGENRIKFAEQLLREGIDNRDEERLDIALQRFIEIKSPDAPECFEIKGDIAYVKADYETAAREFYTAGKMISANHCWFLALKKKSDVALPEMVKIADTDPDCRDSLQYWLISHLKINSSADFFVSALNKCASLEKNYAKELKNDIFLWDNDYESWQWCFNEILRTFSNTDLSNDQVLKISNAIDEQNLFVFDTSILVGFYFKTKLYDKLGELESQDLSVEDRKKVNRAKAYKEGFPKSLHIFNETKDYATICDIYKEEYAVLKDKIVEKMDSSSAKLVFDANKQIRSLDNSELTCLFAQYIDSDVWNAYFSSQKKNLNYRQECVNLLCQFVSKRNDGAFVRDVIDKLKKNAQKDTTEGFNLFYICCLGIANEHPIDIDLKTCMSVLKRSLDDVQAVVTKYDLAFNDLAQFGRLFEYISAQSADDDKFRYWGNVEEFYEKVQKLALLKPDQRTFICKRIVFSKEQIGDAFERLSRKRGLKTAAIEDYLRRADIFRREARELRIENTIPMNDKIEALANSKDVYSQTMKIASNVWKNEGFIIKHQVKAEEPAETAAPLPVESDQILQATESSEVKEPVAETPVAAEPVLPVEEVKEVAALVVEQEPAPLAPAQEQNAVVTSETVSDDSETKAEEMSAEVVETKEPAKEPARESKPVVEPEVVPQEKSDSDGPMLYPESLTVVILGYTIKGEREDDDYCVSVSSTNAQGKEVLLCSVNSYGPSPKRQKGLHIEPDGMSFRYGDLPKVEISPVDGCYVVSIGSISMKVKEAAE